MQFVEHLNVLVNITMKKEHIPDLNCAICFGPGIAISCNNFTILSAKNRHYKNGVPKNSGWSSEVMLGCKQEADRLGLKNEDLWGGLIFDEMTIQVQFANCI